MNSIKLTELYEAMIDDIFELLKLEIPILSEDSLKDHKKVQAFESMKVIDKKLFCISQIIRSEYIKDYNTKNIKEKIGEFLDNLNNSNFFDNDNNSIVDNNDILLVYGILCGISIIFQKNNISILSNLNFDNYTNFKKLVMSINRNNEEFNNYYKKRFTKFNNTTKNKDTIYLDWVQLLLRNDINKIIAPKQKKKINESKKDNVIENEKDITSLESKNTEEITINNNNSLNKENENANNESSLVISGNLSISSQNNSEENDEIDDINYEELEKALANNNNKPILKAFKTLQKKINKLEKNQLFLFHEVSILHNCRDISKSIFFYYYQYITKEIKEEDPFNRLKIILNSLKNKNDEMSKKMAKFLRLIFFINRYCNKVLHRKIENETKKYIEKEVKKAEMPFMPAFSFDQCLESLSIFLNGIYEKKEIQIILKEVYLEYCRDKGLEIIFDSDKEVISLEDEKISFSFNGNDVLDIKKHLKSISLGRLKFDELCNEKNWDLIN